MWYRESFYIHARLSAPARFAFYLLAAVHSLQQIHVLSPKSINILNDSYNMVNPQAGTHLINVSMESLRMSASKNK